MPEQRRATRGIAALLASLSALGPFSIDTYLPAFPDIASTLGASQLDVQQTLSVYLLAFAVASAALRPAKISSIFCSGS